MTADAVGGVWTYALDLGRELTASGMRVSLAVLGPDPDEAQREQARTAGLPLFELGGALDWTAAAEDEIAESARALASLALRLQPDLIHLNSPALAAFEVFDAPVLAACHSCVATWWAAVKGEAPLPRDLAWRAALTARGYASADALLAPSRAFAEATCVTYGLPMTPHVILNGRGSRAELPAEGRENTTVEVFTAGRLWDGGKDLATLDRAAARLSSFDVAAAGPIRGPNGEAVAFPSTHLLGSLKASALSAYLARRPIFVSPSLYEPFGLAVLEAAQARCPLVLSDIATFRELWDGAAVFFPAGDDAALALALTDLAAEPERRTALGIAARARAGRYTSTAMARGALHLYAQLSPAFARARVVA